MAHTEHCQIVIPVVPDPQEIYEANDGDEPSMEFPDPELNPDEIAANTVEDET